MMPSSPLARAAAREEQQKATNERIQRDLAEAKKRPVLVETFKATQENFAPANVFTMKWRLNLPHGVPYESIFQVDTFTLFGKLEPGMRIEIVPEDMSFIAEIVVLERSGQRTKVHELWRHDLPTVGASGADGVTGDYQSFHVGGGKWKVKRLAFQKPSGNMEPERTYPNTFASQFEADSFIRDALIGR